MTFQGQYVSKESPEPPSRHEPLDVRVTRGGGTAKYACTGSWVKEGALRNESLIRPWECGTSTRSGVRPSSRLRFLYVQVTLARGSLELPVMTVRPQTYTSGHSLQGSNSQTFVKSTVVAQHSSV